MEDSSTASTDKVELRGLVNLLVLILVAYTIRAIITSYELHNFLFIEELKHSITASIIKDPKNIKTFVAIVLLLVFAAFSYWIEIIAASNANRYLVYTLIVLNIIGNLTYPIIVSFKIESHPLLALYLMLFATG